MIANSWLVGEADARSQSHGIEWIGDRSCFIEFVDAPDQPSFVVPPSAKIFEVGVTHGEHRWRLCKLRKQRLDRFAHRKNVARRNTNESLAI